MDSIQPLEREIYTQIEQHQSEVAAQESAALLITERLFREEIKTAIQLALDPKNDGYEFGFTAATDPESGTTHTSNPTKGYRPNTAPSGIPNSLVESQCESTALNGNEPSRESTARYAYENLIGVHTHPPIAEGKVGLSAGDLRDDIFAGNNLSRNYNPYEIYRAKAAIVFTDDSQRLEDRQNSTSQINLDTGISQSQKTKTKQSTSNERTSLQPVLDERPRIRPWLHLIERNEKANNLSKDEANNLHHQTLLTLSGDTPSSRYQEIRNKIDEYVSEIIIPLSP